MLSPPELIKCPYCKYEWYSKSKLRRISCPNCRSNFDRRKLKKEEKNG
jgi:ssDNA-binding Zn-finger/Zn-ribbon topoisomerase 1